MVLSTSQVASVCGVSLRTACKWIDTGMLKGYRVPGSRHRRVAGADLRAFMVAHGMDCMLPRLDNITGTSDA